MIGAALMLAAGCDESGPDRHSAQRWVAVARQQIAVDPPSSATLQLHLDRPCALRHTFSFEGSRLEVIGSATARYGTAGEGLRYQCAFGGGEPANVRIEVVLLSDQARLTQYRDLLADRSGNYVVQRGRMAISIAEDHPPAGQRTYDAEAVFPEMNAVVRMLVEVTDPQRRAGYTVDDVADLFVAEVVNED